MAYNRGVPNQTQALALMRENMDHNPGFTDGYWFPNGSEYRLVYADPTVLPTDPEDGIATFWMRHEDAGATVPMSVGIVRPEEVGIVPLPPRWRQTWQDAVHAVAPVRVN